MDGRGLDSVILSAPASVAHYGGNAAVRGALLVITAQAAHLVARDAPADAGDAHGAATWPRQWKAAARLLKHGCALGYEGGWIDADVLALLASGLAPAHMLDIGPEVSRQISLG